MIGYLLLVGVSGVSVVPGVVSKCCLPLQGQTYMDLLKSLSGRPQEKRFKQMMFSYDAKARKFAYTHLTQLEGNEFNSIQDFAAVKEYYWNHNTCQVSPSGAFYNICIPAKAKLVRKSFMGVPPSIINLDTYMLSQNNYTILYRVGLNCTYVEMGGLSSKIPQPDGQILYIFYNSTMGIKDPSVFIPPKICFKNSNSDIRLDAKMISFFLLVGVSVSVVPGALSNCCLPLQVQTYMDVMTSLSGSPQEKRFKQMMFSYDAKSHKIASIYLTQPEGYEVNIIQDFAAGKEYHWNLDTCKVFQSGAFYNMCIPAEAKLVQKTFMGVAPDIINLDTYMRRRNNYTQFYRLGLNCTFVEIGESSSNIPEPDRQLLYVFYNTTMGIKDPSIFIPPKMCFKNVTKIDRKPCFQPNHIINYLGDANPCFS